MKAYKHEDHMKNDHESRITRLEVTIENINQTLIRVENRLEHLENKIDDGFKSLNNRIWNNFYWMVAGFGSVLTLIAHSLHWI